MNYNLKGKVAIIGGSSKGLGKACAISLAREGVNIVLCARNTDELLKTKKEIINLGVNVLALSVDMSSESDNNTIIKTTISTFGCIDILVNNSGGPKPGSILELTMDDWDRAYNSVLKYNIRMIKGCIPFMQKNKWGRIINITSLSVKEPVPTLLLSNVFRSGVTSLAKSISKELISDCITINNVCPGAFKTDRAINLMKVRAEKENKTIHLVEEESVKSFPQKRYQHPEELGDLVCFLASDIASSITGTTIQIDGGISNSLL
ncbi:MAG: SDR family oxidoreductase [Bacteroidales bacterium]|nr:SDR family oxidoreductase [Bacteroidales bacterium]